MIDVTLSTRGRSLHIGRELTTAVGFDGGDIVSARGNGSVWTRCIGEIEDIPITSKKKKKES